MIEAAGPRWNGLPLVPVEDDDHWEQKLDLLRRDPVPAVSFTFAIPPRPVIDALRSRGSVVMQTVTNAAEARAAAAAGDPGAVHRWAGTGYRQAVGGPAADVLRSLASESRSAEPGTGPGPGGGFPHLVSG